MAEESKHEAAKTTKEAQPAHSKQAGKPAKVNYVYGALLLHSAGKAISEAGLKRVIEATGEKPEEAQIKALVSSLEGVDIDSAIKSAAMPVAAAPAAGPAKEEKKAAEVKEEDQEKKAEEAAAGLSSLFG